MSQSIWDTIVAAGTSGNQLADLLNDFKAAIVSGLSGTSRPAELEAGGMWIDTTSDPSWSLKIYDGTNDITLFVIDTTANTASITGSANLFTISKISADTASPILELLKARIINNGQVLANDYIGTIQFKGNADDLSVPVTVRMRGLARENFTGSAAGTDLIFEATAAGSVAIAEWMRLRDGKLGVGTSNPSDTIHALGSGIRSEKISADAVGPKVVARKRRVATNGQVLSGDVVGVHEFNSTDEAGTEILAAKIEVSATENHSSTAHGTKVSVSAKNIGSTTFEEKIVIDENTQLKTKLKLDQQVDSTSTGSAASLTPTKSIVKVTNASLTSIGNIVALASGVLILVNGTGASVTLLNDTGGTAANRIKTGTGVDITVANNAAVMLGYDSDASRWQVIGGSGGGSSALDVVNKTANYTLVPSDDVITANTSGGAFALTLETAVSNTGIVHEILLVTAGNILTINTTSGQTINGISSGAIKMATAGDRMKVVSDGTNWKILDWEINVSAEYTTNTAQSMTNNAETTVDFEDLVEDNLGLVSTGGSWVFTPPYAGLYHVEAVTNAAIPSTTGYSCWGVVYKAGSIHRLGAIKNGTTVDANGAGGECSSIVRCSGPSDTLTYKMYQSSGGSRNLDGSATDNWIRITRIGN